MKKAEWKNYFAPQILKRGYDYYRSGYVMSVFDNDAESCIEAEVSGTENYSVNIYFDVSQKNIVDMYCDCPYAEDGSHCKHMAAVLYAVDDDFKNVSSDLIQTTNPDKSLKDIIKAMPEDKAKELLLFAAEKDKNLADKIMFNGAEKISDNQLIACKREIRLMINSAADGYDFIDYDNAYDLTNDLMDFVENISDALIDQKNYFSAFNLVCFAYDEINSYEMDDSDGGLSMFEDTCFDIWEEIIENADIDLKRNAYNWFLNHKMHQLMYELFDDREFLETNLSVIDSELQKDSENKSFYIPYYVKTKCEIMRRLGYSQPEIDSFRKKYRHLYEVRQQEAMQYINNKQFAEAEKLIEQSKIIDKDTVYIKNWSELLLKIYKETKQQEKYKHELDFLVFNSNQFDFANISELKNLTTKREWNDILKRLINSKSIDYIKCDLLCREGMYRELLNLLISKGSSYYFAKYDNTLRKELPIETRDAFLKVLNQEMQAANQRSAYFDLAHRLCKIKNYPDGSVLANNTAREWAVKYKRRSAMLEELRYVGFDV